MLPASKLQELRERGDTTVMGYVYDKEFDPWDADRLRAVATRIADVTRRCDTEDEARERVAGLPDVAAFADTHATFYRRLTEPSTVRNHLPVFLSIIELRASVQSGAMTEDQAAQQAGQTAVDMMLRQVERDKRNKQ